MREVFARPMLSGRSPLLSLRALALLAGATATLLAIWATPASAIEHVHTISFKGSGANELSKPTSADVDNSAGSSKNDVYVTDEGKQRVEKFDADGNFILSFGSGELGTPKFIAVDSSSSASAGDVYVADTGSQTIRKYTEAGALVTGFGTSGVLNGSSGCGGFGSIGGIDVDSSGTLYTWDVNNSRVCRFSETGTFVSKFEGESNGVCRGHSAFGFGIAPDGVTYYKIDGSPALQRMIEESGSSHCVQISEESNVAGFNLDSDGTVYAVSGPTYGSGTFIQEFQFEPDGTPIKEGGASCTSVLNSGGPGCPPTAKYGSGVITGGEGIGVALNKNLYVADTAGGEIDVFKATPVPTAETLDPIGNSEVKGKADPNGVGPITECYFEFGLTTTYGSTQACEQSVPFNTVQEVTAALPGLVGEETYHYRLVLANGEPGIIGRGKDKTITPHNVKQTKTEDATEVTRTTARLNGSFEGTNQATTYYFQYGTSTAYGSRLPLSPTEENAGTTTGTTPMSVVVGALKPDTIYHFRVVAKNELGISPGKDKSFHTPLAVQGVTTEDASDITRTTAELNGSYTGNGEPHTFKFEWGATTAYGHVVEGTAPTGAGKLQVSAEVEGLQVQLPTSLPYHYRLVMTNVTGSTNGADRTFATAPPEVPVISGESSEGVTPTEATLNATINPGEGETIYVFEYGTDTGYGAATPIEPVGDDTSDHGVSGTLTGLSPGTTYHYRAVAINFTGTAHGEDLTFTTPDVPGIESSGASGVTRSSAHLTMSVSGNASPTNVHFEYGPTAAYGTSTSPSFVGSSQIVAPASADIGGLSAGTTYHYRAVAVNAIGATTGPDLTFTTLPEVAHEEELKPVPCKKGFVRRHGKCVKRHHRKHKRHHHRRHG